MKNRIFVKANSEFVIRFIYKNIICRHECLKRLMINNDLKNKKLIETFAQKYRIKRLIILVFYSQVNEIIERKHISIKNDFSKLTLKDGKKIRHYYSVLWADRTTVKRFTEMTFFRVIIETEVVLLLKFNVSIWQLLSWKKIHSIIDYLILRTRQI